MRNNLKKKLVQHDLQHFQQKSNKNLNKKKKNKTAIIIIINIKNNVEATSTIT